MKAGIAIDPWKLSIFERHLTQAGYVYTLAGSSASEFMTISVVTENVEALGEVVKAANSEAAKTGKPK